MKVLEGAGNRCKRGTRVARVAKEGGAEAEREDLSVMPMRRIFQKCANNLAAAGAEPVAAELVIFLPETVEEPELKALMEEAEKAATDLNIQIIGGQTRVSSAVRQPIAWSL